ncbi:MAG: vacuolar family H+-ATPase subunit H [Clostridium sp.]|nr:vacuolar family H+-ATPase subunit H [Clostridium sp.]MBO6150152.1 vacuolar family H+-ATPase subunit H [Clostridium sp.]
MSSKIEQIITEIEDYIASCKPQPFSNSRIIVNKEEIEELLVELRMRIPEEVKQYQKIISNQDAILAEAHAEADKTVKEAHSQVDTMIAQAEEQTNEMVNEHEIMQRAYEQANQVIEQANSQAQQIVDNAVNEANSIRQSSIKYTDDMLASLQTIVRHTLDDAQGRFDSFRSSMQSSYEIVSANRQELSGSIIVQPEEPEKEEEESEEE